MHVKPPRVPPAVQIAYSSTQGPRVLPGTYTVRLTKGAQVIETKLEVGLDRRAPYSVADRSAELDAAMRAKDLFGTMSALTDRIDGAKRAVAERRGAVGEKDPLVAKLGAIEKELEEARKKIVATKEGERSPVKSGSASTSTSSTARSHTGKGARRRIRSSASALSPASSTTWRRRSRRSWSAM